MAHSHKILAPKELFGLVLAAVGLLLVFFLGAPAAAGVTDMTLARSLLLGGWLAAVVLAFFIEKLSARSPKRIVTAVIITAIGSGALALCANGWIVNKKTEQEAKAAAKASSSTAEAKQSDQSNTPPNSNAAEQPKTRDKNSRAERLRQLRRQRMKALDYRNPK